MGQNGYCKILLVAVSVKSDDDGAQGNKKIDETMAQQEL